jgi:UDP-3-O-[3-hydroxymyristoyl] glucosamine N-acyltransferase
VGRVLVREVFVRREVFVAKGVLVGREVFMAKGVLVGREVSGKEPSEKFSSR